MKTILSAALLTVLSTSAIFGQTKEKTKSQVTFCNIISEQNEISIKYSDLGKCDELLTVDKNLKIKSFTISAKVFSKDLKEDIWVDKTNAGGKLSKENLDFIKKLETEKVKKILIESVIALDGTGEKKISGLVINLK